MGRSVLKMGKSARLVSFTWRIRYVRQKDGEITFKLGSQRKNSHVEANELWFGMIKTKNCVAELKKKHENNSDECIRGVMEHGGKVYRTKWRCH